LVPAFDGRVAEPFDDVTTVALRLGARMRTT
jgi:hypothetical protein